MIQNFITELASRFLADTPKFFKIVRTIGIVITILSGFAMVLASNGDLFSEQFNYILAQVIMYSGIVTAFISQLTATTEAKIEKKIND
jgi:hypothetical protein